MILKCAYKNDLWFQSGKNESDESNKENISGQIYEIQPYKTEIRQGNRDAKQLNRSIGNKKNKGIKILEAHHQ